MTMSKEDELKKSEFYAQHIKNWQESDMAQKEYCKSNSISYPAFVYWRIKFRSKSKKMTSREQTTFVPVTLPPADSQSTVASSVNHIISVTLPNGIQVAFPLTIGPTFLGEYIKAIRDAS